MIEPCEVTIAGAVPSIWLSLLRYLDDRKADLSSLRAVVSGGVAATPSLVEEFDQRFGLEVWQGWGMTETSPLGTFSRLPKTLDDLSQAERYKMRAKQGRPVPGIKLRVVNGDPPEEVAWDGSTVGELQARGPWVAKAYLGLAPDDSFAGGWLKTGDVAVIDDQGFIQIVDRTKDLVKSGGEWISTLELEAALVEHADVIEAAVVAVPSQEWGERPLAFVTLRPGTHPATADLLAPLRDRFPTWWLPDDVRIVDEIPKTSVGKIDKRSLRERLVAAQTP